jgi:hypothetical protein
MPDEQQGNQQAQPNTGDATGQQQGGSAQQQGNGGQGNDDKKFTQAELDAHIKARLDQAQRTAEAKAQKDREAAEAKALEEQSKFKELADQRAAKIAELEPLEIQLKEANDALTAALGRERQDLPAHITSLLDDKTPAAQLTWIAANREAIGKASDGQQPPAGGTRAVPTTPRPSSRSETQADRIKHAEERLAASGRYGRL